MKNMLCVGLLPEEIRGVKAKAAKALLELVADEFGVSAEDILGESRLRIHSVPRFYFYVMCKDVLHFTYDEICNFTNRKRLTVIVKGVTRVRQILRNPNMQDKYDNLIKKLENEYI